MTDLLDEAQAKTEAERQASIARAVSKLDGEAQSHCADCEAPIPEARRRAVPNVRRCVSCQEDFEGVYS